MKSWRSLVAAAHALACRLGITAGKNFAILGTVPPQHICGLETTIMLPLQSGMAIHSARPLLPADIAAALASCRPRAGSQPLRPSARLHRRGGRISRARRHALRHHALARRLSAAVESRWNVPVLEIYGCTEAGTVALAPPGTRGARGARVRACSCGRRGDDTLDFGRAPGWRVEASRLHRSGGRTGFVLRGRPGDMVKIAGKRASSKRSTASCSESRACATACFSSLNLTAPTRGGWRRSWSRRGWA